MHYNVAKSFWIFFGLACDGIMKFSSISQFHLTSLPQLRLICPLINWFQIMRKCDTFKNTVEKKLLREYLLGGIWSDM